MNGAPFSLVVSFIAASGLSACFATALLRRWAPRLGLIDLPNERSLHFRPTPRAGGVSFLVIPALTVAALWLLHVPLPRGIFPLYLGSLLVAAVSLADDRWHLPIPVRLAFHAAAALLLIAGAGWIREIAFPGGTAFSLGLWGPPLTFVWIVGLVNAYNFMDGIDGMAAGQAIVIAVAMAGIARLQGAEAAFLAMALTAGAAAGFLPHNWPPARIFMGDVGSAFLGYSFAGWAVISGGNSPRPLPFLAWVAVLSPLLFDTGATLLLRLLRGKRWHEAHREHFYQRLVGKGWSHLAVSSLYAGLSTLAAAAAVAYFGCRAIHPAMLIVLLLLIPAGIAILVHRVENRPGSCRK